ncbi:MAG TPA: 6-phosphogluconolactonase [Candidatus Baltobacteraceae bacterium]|jgi:6-phosphogluconolactonase|nr:6-phosphogluconolactonase [Candidatus Baltobacteraceae bacterium]
MIDRTHPDVAVLDGPQQVAEALADAFVSEARGAIEARGSFYASLSGGTTPKAAYGLLAQPPRRDTVDWNAVYIFFGDERCVPPDHPDSNYRMAKEAFLDSVGIPAGNVHRIRGEEEPSEAARRYAAEVAAALGGTPHFDFIMLGMGPDGHTASLFPGTDPLTDDDMLVRAVYVEKFSTHRITFTPRVINNARRVVIAVEGLPKAPALYAVLRGPYDPTLHPIQIVAPPAGRLTWLVDKAAAAELPTK